MALEGSKSNNTVVYSSKYHCVWTPKYRRSVLVGPIAKRCEPVIRPLKNIGLKSSPGKSCPSTCLCSLKWTRSSASTDWSRISREFPGTHCGKSFAHGNHGYQQFGRIAISYPRLAGQHNMLKIRKTFKYRLYPTAMRSVSHVMSILILCRAGSSARLNANQCADHFARPENVPRVAKSPALVSGEFLSVDSAPSILPKRRRKAPGPFGLGI